MGVVVNRNGVSNGGVDEFCEIEGPLPLRAVLADADVDAPNLELVLSAHTIEAHEFRRYRNSCVKGVCARSSSTLLHNFRHTARIHGGSKANIEPDSCNNCGVCVQVCRFDAIQAWDGQCSVDIVACDGCAACVYQCPTQAIHMEPNRLAAEYRGRFAQELRAAWCCDLRVNWACRCWGGCRLIQSWHACATRARSKHTPHRYSCQLRSM
jgi:MinD superfamily P-loop ATPase